MHGEVAIAEVKPGFAAETFEGIHENRRVSGAAPAGLRIGEARQGVDQRVDIGANSQAEMFEIVADVEQYPLFLPLCEALHIESRDTTGGITTLIATMEVGYKAIRERFTTKVTLTPAAPRIDVSYLDGPFRYLENRWQFHPTDDGCEIDFFIDYEFRSPMMGMLLGTMFDRAFRKFAQSFEQRAREVYGIPPSPENNRP